MAGQHDRVCHGEQYLFANTREFASFRRLGDNHDELIASESVNIPIGAECQFQTLGHIDQQLIANGMTQRIIDDFESIQVQKQDGELLGGIAIKQFGQLTCQSRTVWEIG